MKIKITYIIACIMFMPMYLLAVTYTNKTPWPLMIHTIASCHDARIKDLNDHGRIKFIKKIMYERNQTMHTVCIDDQCYDDTNLDTQECFQEFSVTLGKGESVDLDNEQNRPVTIMSEHLQEKREFFPTNNSFNYEITVGAGSSKYPKLTINRAE